MNRLLEDISNIQNEFYSSRRKHIFRKAAQKNECAEYITKSIPLADLIYNTIYVIPNTDAIFIDYLVFKTYATTENYKEIVMYLFKLINETIQQYHSFNLHVNLSTFSISAAERYLNAIQLFCLECNKSDQCYVDIMNQMYIYNTPSMINHISSMLVRVTNERIKDKIIYFSKDESNMQMEKLISNPYKQSEGDNNHPKTP